MRARAVADAAGARDAEAARAIRYEVVTNNGEPGSLEKLIELKNIFSTQLPKMPKEYIVRLVFDRRHYSLAIVKGTHIIGGICYRPYYPQQFLEIAFLGISASEQVRGFGTRVMSHLKERAKTEGVLYFLTYADNFAIGYFKKQGFTKSVRLPKERWYGLIKDYDGGTLMECYVHPSVDFLSVRETLTAQREFIVGHLTSRFEASPVQHQTAKIDPSRPLLEQIPGLEELGYTEAELAEELHNPDAARRNDLEEAAMTTLVERLKAHEAAWPFDEPVDTVLVSDYLDVVTNPTDLRTIEERQAARQFKNFASLKAELLRMLANCRDYNGTGIYVRTADSLEKFLLAECRSLWEDARRAPGSSEINNAPPEAP